MLDIHINHQASYSGTCQNRGTDTNPGALFGFPLHQLKRTLKPKKQRPMRRAIRGRLGHGLAPVVHIHGFLACGSGPAGWLLLVGCGEFGFPVALLVFLRPIETRGVFSTQDASYRRMSSKKFAKTPVVAQTPGYGMGFWRTS